MVDENPPKEKTSVRAPLNRRMFIGGVGAGALAAVGASGLSRKSEKILQRGVLTDPEAIRHCEEIVLLSPFTELARQFRTENYDGLLVHDTGHSTAVRYKTLVLLLNALPEITQNFEENPVPDKENAVVQALANSEVYRTSRSPEIVEEIRLAREELEKVLEDNAITSHPTDSFVTPSAWAVEQYVKENSPAVGLADQLITWFKNALVHGGEIEKAWTQARIERNEHMASVITEEYKGKKFIFSAGTNHLRGEADVQHFLREKSPNLKCMEIETLMVKKPSEAGKLYSVEGGHGHFVFTVLEKEKGCEVASDRNAMQHGIYYMLHSSRDRQLGPAGGGGRTI